jgi:hypothetical protein
VRDLRKDPRYKSIRRPTAAEAEEMRALGEQALPGLRTLADDLVAGRGAPYEVGTALHRTAMGGVGPVGLECAQCHRLWLLWGGLTDWVETRPAERQAAEEAMRRAAREWLEVVDDESAWRPYFDRWLDTELNSARRQARSDGA